MRERVVLSGAPAIAFLAGLDRLSTLLHGPHKWQGGDSILSRTGEATARGVPEVYVEGVLELRSRLVLVVVQARLSEGSLNLFLDDEGLIAVGACQGDAGLNHREAAGVVHVILCPGVAQHLQQPAANQVFHSDRPDSLATADRPIMDGLTPGHPVC
jgi:hypothetical protein